MYKQGKTTIVLSVIFILVILTSSIYFVMDDKVKIHVENTRTKFYVWEDTVLHPNGTWVLGGTEYVHLYDGTTKMRAKSRVVNYTIDGFITTIIRNSTWKDNITTIDKYVFYSNVTAVELVPIDHTVQCINCEGKIVHFEYRDLEYDGITRPAISPELFGHRMKVEWYKPDNFMWAKVYQQKVASDKLVIRYRALDNDETFSVRMFDPVEGTYVSSWSLHANNEDARGITTDGTNIWIFDDDIDNERMYKYTIGGSYVGVSSFYTYDSNPTANGLANYGSYIYTIGSDYIVRFTKSTMSYSTRWDVYGNGNDDAEGIATDGNYIYTSDDEDEEVYKWSMTGAYISKWGMASGIGRPDSGMTTDGTHIWVGDYDDDLFYKHTMAGNSVSNWAMESNSRDITVSGNYFYVLYTYAEKVNIYTRAFNEDPVLTGIPDKSTDEDITPDDNFTDLYSYASDSDDSDAELTFTITSETNTSLIDCSIVGDRYIDCATPAANQSGYSDVVVRATDTGALYNEDTFRMTVNAVNDAPVLTGVINKSVTEGGNPGDNWIDLYTYHSDIDGSDAASTFAVQSQSNSTLISCSVVDDRYINCTNPVGFGYSDIVVNVTDAGNLTDNDTFRVTVNSVIPFAVLNYPTDGATDIELNPTLNITVDDADSVLLNVTIFQKNGSDFIELQSNNSVANGTEILYLWSGLEHSTTYFHCINITDGEYNYSNCNTWNFTTYYIPVTETSTISPTYAGIADDLEGNCNVTDGDNDTIKYYWRWYKDGVLNSSGNDSGGNTQGIVINLANISNANTVLGESWIFECRGYDGNYSDWLNSSAKTISPNSTLDYNISELGSDITIEFISDYCVDIDHYDYGINYSCSSLAVFNIGYFRTDYFNDSSTIKNLTYTSPINQTVYIDAHQYDEVINLSMNFTEYDYTETTRMKIYINNTLSNSFLYGFFPLTEDEFDDGNTYKEVEWSVPGLETVGYFNVPANAILLNASMDITGYDLSNYTSYDNDSGSYCESINTNDSTARLCSGSGDTNTCITYEVGDASTYPYIRMRAEEGGDIEWDRKCTSVKDYKTGADFYVVEVACVEFQVCCSNSYITGDGYYADCDSLAYFRITDNATLNKTLKLKQCYNSGIPENTSECLTESCVDFLIHINNTDDTMDVWIDDVLNFSDYDISSYSNLYFEISSYLDSDNNGTDVDCLTGCSSTIGTPSKDVTAIDGPTVENCSLSVDEDWDTATFLNLTGYDSGVLTMWENVSGTENYTNSSAKWVSKYVKPGTDPYNVYVWNHTSSAWVHILNGTTSATAITNRTLLDDDFIGTNIRVKTIMGDDVESMGYYEGKLTLWDEESPYDPYLEIGELDGDREWNYTGLLESTENSGDFVAEIEAYLTDCTLDSDGVCQVPIYLKSYDIGGINLTNLEINFTIPAPKIYLDVDLINDFLESSVNHTQIPIKIYSSENGTMELSTVRYDYKGGNKTYEVKIHSTDYSINETTDVTVYYSDWDYSMPSNINSIRFYPWSVTAQSVQPFGQTSTTPILNITNYAYGGKDFDFTTLINSTESCVNMTISNTNQKSDGAIMSADTWSTMFENSSYLESDGLWMWVDLSCSYTDWRRWSPQYYFRACCDDCSCSEAVV